jgi:hypothetical protein
MHPSLVGYGATVEASSQTLAPLRTLPHFLSFHSEYLGNIQGGRGALVQASPLSRARFIHCDGPQARHYAVCLAIIYLVQVLTHTHTRIHIPPH